MKDLIDAFDRLPRRAATTVYLIGGAGNGWSVHVRQPDLSYKITRGDNLANALAVALAPEDEFGGLI